MKPLSNRRHYRVGKKDIADCSGIFHDTATYFKGNSKHIVLLMIIIYILSNIISFLLGRVCYERNHY